jgi:hypothetical protein
MQGFHGIDIFVVVGLRLQFQLPRMLCLDGSNISFCQSQPLSNGPLPLMNGVSYLAKVL